MRRERVLLKKGNREKLAAIFDVTTQAVSYAMYFDRNSIKARRIRVHAVNHMGADVYLNKKHLI